MTVIVQVPPAPSGSGLPLTGGTLTGNLIIANPNTLTLAALAQGSVLFAGSGGVVSQNNANLFWDDANLRLRVGAPVAATLRGRMQVGQRLTPQANAGSAVFEGAVAIGPTQGAFLSPAANQFTALVLGSLIDANYSGGGNGALTAGARSGAVGLPPVNAPYVGMSQFDTGSGVARDLGRTIFYGGGGWTAPDAHNHQFYTAPTYTETNDTGVLRFAINSDGLVESLARVAFSGTGTQTIAADQNNYDPPNNASLFLARINGGAADRNFTGLLGGVSGRLLVIKNNGTTNNLVLVNESASSTAANRFSLPGAVNLTLTPNDAVLLIYDGTSARWIAVG